MLLIRQHSCNLILLPILPLVHIVELYFLRNPVDYHLNLLFDKRYFHAHLILDFLISRLACICDCCFHQLDSHIHLYFIILDIHYHQCMGYLLDLIAQLQVSLNHSIWDYHFHRKFKRH